MLSPLSRSLPWERSHVERMPDGAAASEWVRAFFRRRRTSGENVFGTGPRPFRRRPRMARLEAALLVADTPLSTRKLAQCAMLADVAEVRTLIDQLNLAYDQTRSAFRIERVATGYQMLTRPKFAAWLDRLHHRQEHLKLSGPAMETLCIVAYRQPITRADIEAVRGVQTTEILKQLMERNLVRIVGEEDTLGRPYLYGTTREFLELFGLQDLDELPMAASLRGHQTPVSDSLDSESSAADDAIELHNPPAEAA